MNKMGGDGRWEGSLFSALDQATHPRTTGFRRLNGGLGVSAAIREATAAGAARPYHRAQLLQGLLLRAASPCPPALRCVFIPTIQPSPHLPTSSTSLLKHALLCVARACPQWL
jgi:hypothetical protein